MKKIFRMQYEPCNGDCYAWDSRAPVEVLLKNQPKRLATLIKMMKAIHEPSCGNKNIRYGIDLDEENSLFISSFYHYGKLELFSGTDLIKTLEALCNFVVDFYSKDTGIDELKQDPGLGHEVCAHNSDNRLERFITGQFI